MSPVTAEMYPKARPIELVSRDDYDDLHKLLERASCTHCGGGLETCERKFQCGFRLGPSGELAAYREKLRDRDATIAALSAELDAVYASYAVDLLEGARDQRARGRAEREAARAEGVIYGVSVAVCRG